MLCYLLGIYFYSSKLDTLKNKAYLYDMFFLGIKISTFYSNIFNVKILYIQFKKD